MHLEMSASKILADRHLWHFKTTKILQKWLQTWFTLLYLALVWNVHVKSIWTHSVPSSSAWPTPNLGADERISAWYDSGHEGEINFANAMSLVVQAAVLSVLVCFLTGLVSFVTFHLDAKYKFCWQNDKEQIAFVLPLHEMVLANEDGKWLG